MIRRYFKKNAQCKSVKIEYICYGRFMVDNLDASLFFKLWVGLGEQLYMCNSGDVINEPFSFTNHINSYSYTHWDNSCYSS